MNIAEKLVKLRKESGLTQEDLAQKLGISISAIRNYESIKSPREPKNDILLKFADFYNVSTEYLLNDEITNKTTDNIIIGNKLKLSDKAIEKIVEINTTVNNDIINKFIEFISVEKFWKKINTHKDKSKQIAELLPLKDITTYMDIFNKYTTDDIFEGYYVFNEDCGMAFFNINAFCQNNKCKYSASDKSKILEYLNLIKSNKELTKYNGEDFNYILQNYNFSIETLEKIVNANGLMPIHVVRILLSIPQIEINERNHDKELIEFQLLKELSNFLAYMDKEQNKAE